MARLTEEEMLRRVEQAPTEEQHAAADARVDARERELALEDAELFLLHGGQVQPATAREVAVALQRHGMTAVRGEEERDVASALQASYRARRQSAAGTIRQLAQQLEEESNAERAWLVGQDILHRVQRYLELGERERYHEAVATGETNYGARDDAE